MNDIKLMNKAADNIRILAASMVEKAKSGHPGGAMGGADFVNVLFSEFLVYDPKNPTWEGRDRYFQDPGHMSPMLYSVLALIINIGKSIEYRINTGNNIIPRLAQPGNQTAPEAFFFFAHPFFLVSI